MGICYYCESDISALDIILQKRSTLLTDGKIVGDVHKNCFTLEKKYGLEYFVKKQYLEYNQSLSDYDLTRILTVLNEKSVSKKDLAERLDLNYDHIKEFWEFLTIKQYITIKVDAPTLPKSNAPTVLKPDAPTLPKIS